MPSEEHFFDKDVVKHLVIEYAFKIPLKQELSLTEKKILQETLRDLDPTFFQVFDEPVKNSPVLFSVSRQVVFKKTIPFPGPAFVLTRDCFSFFVPYVIQNNKLEDFSLKDTNKMNAKISSWAVKTLSVFGNRCLRTGKIYELAIGPFKASEKSSIFNGFSLNDIESIGELSISYTKIDVSKKHTPINVVTMIHFLQADLSDDFFLNVKVDINNRELKETIEQGEIEMVWNYADLLIDKHLKDIFK